MKFFRLKYVSIVFLLALFASGLSAAAHAASVSPDINFFADDLIAKESYRKISMDFRDASLKDVFKIFSEQSGLNFIASESVKDRTLTLYLDQVPLQEALKKIMAANNLAYDLDPGSNIFIVRETGRPEMEIVTRVYYLKYARSKDSNLQKEIQNAASGATLAAATGTGGGGGGGGSSSSTNMTDIMDSIKNVLSSQGKVIYDVRTNSIIVSDLPSQFDLVEKVIALLDTPSPQVLIEVEMLDVSKTTADDMGVKYDRGNMLDLTGSKTDTKFPNIFAKGDTFSGPQEFTYGTLSAAVFHATLNMLKSDTKTKFLARPRILTLSNETAEIKITTNEAIGTTRNVNGEGASSTSTETAERAQTGVSLRVTPQVDPQTNMVTLSIVPVVSETKPSKITVNGQPARDPEVRSTASTLLVKNGETIVVGGLIRNREDETIDKIPVLGDIPVIGAAFRHKTVNTEERELIVFITPHIVGYENSATLAKGDSAFPSASATVEYREQAVPVSHKEKVDNMLERWES